MNTAAKIFTMLVWMGGLAVAGSIVLTITASRVGEHKSSTYGNAYIQFQIPGAERSGLCRQVSASSGHIP